MGPLSGSQPRQLALLWAIPDHTPRTTTPRCLTYHVVVRVGEADGGGPRPAAEAAGEVAIARYLTAGDGRAVQYRLIVDLLLDEQERSLTGLSAAELEALLRDRLGGPPGFEVAARMADLAGWGVADRWDDHDQRQGWPARRVTRYQLTAAAAQLHRAVGRLGPDPAGSLAATHAPAVLAGQLTAMVTGAA